MKNPIINMIETATPKELINISKSIGIGVSPDCTMIFDGDDYCIDFDGLIAYGSTKKEALLELIGKLDAGCGEY